MAPKFLPRRSTSTDSVNTRGGGLTPEYLENLRRFDTCTLSNAIERLQVRPRDEGFIIGDVRCQFPELPPVVGYAVTGRIKSSMPPISGICYDEHMDWWRFVASVPAPRFVVMQDSDAFPGTGAMFGAIHARICRALECVAWLTNGAVRDLPSIAPLGFQLFAGSVSVSHAYSRVVEFGAPVEIGGLRIGTGDLLHGDLHGVHKIPCEVVRDLPMVAEKLLRQEQDLIRLCEQKNFSIEKLAAMLEEQREQP